MVAASMIVSVEVGEQGRIGEVGQVTLTRANVAEAADSQVNAL